MEWPESQNPKRPRRLETCSGDPDDVMEKRAHQVFLQRVEVEGFKTFRDR